ncbi:MAG: exodeoxyribonuclease VII large subunit [Desulfonatronovibrio sp.]
MPQVFSVTELTLAIKEAVEIQFPFIWVRGQISNLSRPGSGHIYFSLKDGQSGLQVVWFKNSQPFSRQKGSDPATTLENGQDVVCAGKIGVYAPRGTYQLVAELVQEQGIGDLFLAFEALKNKLMTLGYFDQERKRTIPFCPDRVGIITAPGGAVIHDFMKVAGDLGLGSRIRLYPSLVQGGKAPKELIKAIKLANRHEWAQVIVLMRGGGSLEDLWAFNDEQVARAVFESKIPVLTGIGHETDTTISDLTADKRVATPSQAAQSLWPQRKDMILDLDEQETALIKRFENFLHLRRQRVDHLARALGWLSPEHRLQRFDERLESLGKYLFRSAQDLWQSRADRLEDLESRLMAKFGPEFWKLNDNNLDYLENRLINCAGSFLRQKQNRLDLEIEKLAGLDPYGPLRRGYSMVIVEKTGRFLRSVNDVQANDDLEITLNDGKFRARSL